MDMAAEALGAGDDAMSPSEIVRTRCIFSPELAARFDELVTKYPLKRSALVPMLLYAQDEVGYVSDAVIAEIAERLGITRARSAQRATYYSMLRTKPAGKFNVQVCTNICCMLRGGYEILDHFQDELGIGHKGVTHGRRLLARRSRVHRRLLLGSRHPGQLRLPRRT